MFRKLLILLFVFSMSAVSIAHSGEVATPEEAKALALKASEAYKKLGHDIMVKKINEKDPEFRGYNGDLYVFLFNMKGVTQAHGFKPNLVGKSLWGLKGIGDTYILQDMAKIAQSKEGAGWYDYNWPRPSTKKIDKKTAYVVRLTSEYWLAVGTYKK